MHTSFMCWKVVPQSQACGARLFCLGNQGWGACPGMCESSVELLKRTMAFQNKYALLKVGVSQFLKSTPPTVSSYNPSLRKTLSLQSGGSKIKPHGHCHTCMRCAKHWPLRTLLRRIATWSVSLLLLGVEAWPRNQQLPTEQPAVAC